MTFKPPCTHCGKPVKLVVSVVGNVVWYEKIKCYKCGTCEAPKSVTQKGIRTTWNPVQKGSKETK